MYAIDLEPFALMLQVVLTDLVKIGVPAFLGYMIAKRQLDQKSQEISISNSFAAREHWFKYYKERVEREEADSKEIQGEIGRLVALGISLKGRKDESSTDGLHSEFEHDVQVFFDSFKPRMESATKALSGESDGSVSLSAALTAAWKDFEATAGLDAVTRLQKASQVLGAMDAIAKDRDLSEMRRAFGPYIPD